MSDEFETTLEELSNLAVRSFQNGLRLHFDSNLLLKNQRHPSSILLSVLAMEEFGKYFSLSSYVFYTSVNETRDKDFEVKYLESLYSHPVKQKAVLGRDGFLPSLEHHEQAKNRIYEQIKQRSTYVGFNRNKGRIQFQDGLNDPTEISKEEAENQVLFVNKLISGLVEEKINGIISMDEEEINELLNKNLLESLELIASKSS